MIDPKDLVSDPKDHHKRPMQQTAYSVPKQEKKVTPHIEKDKDTKQLAADFKQTHKDGKKSKIQYTAEQQKFIDELDLKSLFEMYQKEFGDPNKLKAEKDKQKADADQVIHQIEQDQKKMTEQEKDLLVQINKAKEQTVKLEKQVKLLNSDIDFLDDFKRQIENQKEREQRQKCVQALKNQSLKI